MFVLTDGSPNKPNTHGDDLTNVDTWLEGANAAIDAANAARAAGYVVNAVYLSAPGDPGDTNLPFEPAGDAAWAEAVMTEIGGGSFFNANFNSFIDDLFKAIDCPLPLTDITTRASGNVELGGKIHDVAILSGGKEPTGTITFSLYGPDDANCTGEPVFTDEVDVDGNGDYTSGDFTPTRGRHVPLDRQVQRRRQQRRRRGQVQRRQRERHRHRAQGTGHRRREARVARRRASRATAIRPSRATSSTTRSSSRTPATRPPRASTSPTTSTTSSPTPTTTTTAMAAPKRAAS